MQVADILLANIVLCALLTGLIWTIQVVHYPSFLGVGELQFATWHQQHMNSITFLVGPLMLLEAMAALGFLSFTSHFQPGFLVFLASGLVLFIFAHTFIIAAPLHGVLVKTGYDEALIKKLVATNWWRTIAWTLRLGILIYLYFQLKK